MHVCVYFAKAKLGDRIYLKSFIILLIITMSAAQVKSHFKRSFFGIIMVLVYISGALSALLWSPTLSVSYSLDAFIVNDIISNNRNERDFCLRQYFSIQCASCQMAPLVNLVFVVWKPFVGDREWGPFSPVGLTSWLTAKRLRREKRTTSSSALTEKRWLPRNAIQPVETKTWLSWSKLLDLCRFLL